MEQAAPSSFILLKPDELSGFHYLTISVAPRPVISFFFSLNGYHIIKLTSLLSSLI